MSNHGKENTKNTADEHQLVHHYQRVRHQSVTLINSLSAEDCQLQAMADVSPSKWHLAHTTWFFETFLLIAHSSHYTVFNPNFKTLFNSYYNGIGEQFKRACRGSLSRPSLDDVITYREYVDRAVIELLSAPCSESIKQVIELGLNHEQQHQELMLMDIQYNF